MKLIEFFEDSVMSEMRTTVMDVLTPLAARGVESVSLPALMMKLEDINPGIVMDRDIAMRILDPSAIRLISKVEGDRVYLDQPSKISSNRNEKEAVKAEKRVNKMATKAAKKRV